MIVPLVAQILGFTAADAVAVRNLLFLLNPVRLVEHGSVASI